MRDFLGMMKQAKDLQAKMQQMQEEVAALTLEGSAGGGLVRLKEAGSGPDPAASGLHRPP